MQKSTTICVVLIILITCAAIVLGVIFGLHLVYQQTQQPSSNSTTANNKTNQTSGKEIIQLFVDNVQLPNGSYVVLLSELTENNMLPSPSVANTSVLQYFRLVADQTNDVLVTNRKTFLYLLLPSLLQSPSGVGRRRRQAGSASDVGIGLQFSDSDQAHVIPLSLQNNGEGFQKIGLAPDGSSLYQLPISSPPSLCPASSQSQCVPLTCTAYVIEYQSKSSPSPRSSLSAACGPQCQGQQATCNQSCGVCNGGEVAGADTPVSRRFRMGKSSGTFTFRYQTYTIPDRIKVFQDDQQIFDSGCLGTGNYLTRNITFNGKTDEIRVDVEPNCQGTTGTAWNFHIMCPSPCSNTTQNQAILLNGPNQLSDGNTVYIDEDANMPSLTAYYCSDSSPPATVIWTFNVTSSGVNDAPCANSSRTLKSSSSTWEITSDIVSSDWVMGGKAKLSWTVNGVSSGSISFNILGKQPKREVVMDYIRSLVSGNERLWFAPYIAAHESTQGNLAGPTQFCDRASGYNLCRNADGYPLKSFDDGFGVMQLTNPPPTCNQIWSWKLNCAEGVLMLQRLAKKAWDWMNNNETINPAINKPEGQRVQAEQEMGHAVPVPTFKEDKCVFADGTERVIEDAVAMKMFNGAKANFCAWDNAHKVWIFSNYSIVGEKKIFYVNNVCKLLPA